MADRRYNATPDPDEARKQAGPQSEAKDSLTNVPSPFYLISSFLRVVRAVY